MTVIPAPALAYDRTLESGIRPFDIGRDLRAVAELISTAFSQELDGRGNDALREMRFMSHFGGFLGLMNRSTGEFNDMLSGFVWLEHGQVVGNVTVQRGDKIGERWQIANVAVAPNYRGRGISHQLMDTAIEHAVSCGGRWAVLQVYANNQVARHLYDGMGFEEVDGTTDLRVSRLPAIDGPVATADLRSFSASAWQPLYELANYQLGPQTQWWRPVRRIDFEQMFEDRIGEWFQRLFGQRTIYRRAIQVSPRFESALILRAQRWDSPHQMQLWTRPEHYGVHDATLLRWALATLQDYPRWPIEISLNTKHQTAIDLLQAYGFKAQRTLLTLRKRIDNGETNDA
jgi:ribosomal protein S18 acetylase RimI-like enzyme